MNFVHTSYELFTNFLWTFYKVIMNFLKTINFLQISY